MARNHKRELTVGDRLRRREELRKVAAGPPDNSIENLIVIGASAGGHKALSQVLRDLSENIPAAVIIMLHAMQLSIRDPIQQATRVPVVQIRDRTQLRKGVVHVAPPRMSVTLRGSMLHIAPYYRGSGPATTINTLFESAAENFGDRVIGVVLTGLLRDGTAGLKAVHDTGGLTIVQDPEEAEFPEMPSSAMKDLPVTFCLRLSDIGLTLDLLARRKTSLETGLAVSVRTLQERVALLVRLIGQSKRNPGTHEFLSAEMATLELYLRSIETLLDEAAADKEERLSDNPSSLSKNAFEFLLTDLDTALTFMDVAESTHSKPTRQRNHANARRAYDTVVRLMQNLPLDKTQRRGLAERLKLLKSRLQNAGQEF